MENPSKIEAAARPKDGGAQRQAQSTEKKKPSPPLSHPEFDRPDGSVILGGSYSYEAHHLIPGKEKMLLGEGGGSVMSGHKIEEWIIGGKGKITADSGYSINNSDNGVWLPSVPESLKKLRGRPRTTPWERESHPKPHAEALTHAEKELIALYDRINLWASACPYCGGGEKKEAPPYEPHWKVHDALDRASKEIDKDIRAKRPARWTYFISTHAMNKTKAEQTKLPKSVAVESL